MWLPSFHEGDLDFVNVISEEKHEEETSAISCENIPAEEKQMHQEAPSFCCTGIINAEEEASDEAGFQGEVVVSTGKSQEECYTSSGEDSAQEGEEGGEEMKLVKQLMWDLNGEGDRHGSKGDRPSVERQPLAPEGGENTRVRNKEQGENESDEMSYFQRVPEHGSKTERTEDNQQEPDPESKALNSEEEEEEDYDDERNDDEEEEELLTLCFEQEDKPPHWDNPGGDILDFSELIVEHLQDLIAEVDDGESVEKMKEFSGEEHQDAGESFAEYPSDFSSCEYIEAGEKDEESNGQCTGDRAKRVSDSEALFVGSRETEQGESELVETMSGDTAEKRYETSDSSTSSDDETQTTSDEEPDLTSKDFESKIRLEERHSGSRMSADPGTSLFSDDLLVADKEEFPGVTPAEGVRMFPGSVFTTEHQDSQISELGDLGGDEYEEKTNWEQEQERIKAFYDFYTDSDQVTREAGR